MPIETHAGHAVNMATLGKGPPVVLSHCSLAHMGAWMALMPELVDHQVTVFDLPDHGRSAPMPAGQDSQRKVADIIVSLCHGGAHVVGHSFSGTAALLAAQIAPEKISRLTLIEPVFFSLLKDESEAEGEAAAYVRMQTAFDAGDREAAAKAFVGLWGDGRPWAKIPRQQQTYITERIHVIPQQSPSVMEDCNGVVTAKALAGVSIPVDLVRGAKSPPSMQLIQDHLAAALPNAQAHVIEGAGHMLPMSHPAELGAIIKAER